MMSNILVIDLNYYVNSNANAACLNRVLKTLSGYKFSLLAEEYGENKNNSFDFAEAFPVKVHKASSIRSNGLYVNAKMFFNKIKTLVSNNGINYRRVADTLYGIRTADFSKYDAILSVSNPILCLH